MPLHEEDWEETERGYEAAELEKRLLKLRDHFRKTYGIPPDEVLSGKDAEGPSLQKRLEKYDANKALFDDLEKEFLLTKYGISDPLLEVNDFNDGLDKFIAFKAEELKRPELIEFYYNYRAASEDLATDLWSEFVGTGNFSALLSYIRQGGEIDRAVRLAITNPPPQKNLNIRKRDWWDYQRVRKMMAEPPTNNFEMLEAKKQGVNKNEHKTFLQACRELAEERYGDAEDLDAKIRTIQNRISRVEKTFGSKLPRVK